MSFSSLISFLTIPILLSAASARATVVDSALRRVLRDNPSSRTRVIINLRNHYDLSRIPTSGSLVERRKQIATALKSHTQKLAEPLIKFLKSPEAADVQEVRQLWVTNSLRVDASGETIKKLVELNQAENMYLENRKTAEELGDLGASWNVPPTWAPKIAWGVEQIGAPAAWEIGAQGQGVLVAMIDSGANTHHPDIVSNLWHNPGESGLDDRGRDKSSNGIDDDRNGYIDDVNGWNFEGNNADVSDREGHGSQTAGIVGGNGAGGVQTGVAPKATLMILRACCDAGHDLFESNTWEAMQYAMENGARVISMSMSSKHSSHPTYARWRRADEVMLAGELIHINSAGNRGSGSDPHNIGAPASNPPAWFNPLETAGLTASMITVGATDRKDQVRYYSSRGPVSWEGVEDYDDYPYEGGKKTGLIKPEVCGPSEVPSLEMNGKGYTNHFGGTSSATPHIAGVAALLLSYRPELTTAQMTETLEMSALKVGDSFNNDCGAGRVDASAALDYVKANFQMITSR